MPLDGAVSKISSQDYDNEEQLVLDVQGPASYTASGEAIPAGYLPFRVGNRIDHLHGNAHDAADGFCVYDPTGDLLRFYTAGGVEVGGGVDLSTITFRLVAVGH